MIEKDDIIVFLFALVSLLLSPLWILLLLFDNEKDIEYYPELIEDEYFSLGNY